MPNPSRPDPRCPTSCDDFDASGASPACEHASCELCDGPVSREQVAASLTATGGPASAGVFCGGCLVDDESDGVPVEVPEEASCAQTVRLETDPTIRESGIEWAEKLDAREAA